VPHTDRQLGVIRRQLRFSAEEKPVRHPRRRVGRGWTVETSRLGDQKQAVALREDVPPGRALDRDAVHHGAAEHDTFARLDLEAGTGRGLRKDGRASLAALGELRADAEGRVEEEIRGVEMVELAVHVVDPDQGRKPIAKKVLLNPRLFERPCRRGFDAAHALGVSGEVAGPAALDRKAIEKNRRAAPAHEAFHVEREQKVQIAE